MKMRWRRRGPSLTVDGRNAESPDCRRSSCYRVTSQTARPSLLSSAIPLLRHRRLARTRSRFINDSNRRVNAFPALRDHSALTVWRLQSTTSQAVLTGRLVARNPSAATGGGDSNKGAGLISFERGIARAAGPEHRDTDAPPGHITEEVRPSRKTRIPDRVAEEARPDSDCCLGRRRLTGRIWHRDSDVGSWCAAVLGRHSRPAVSTPHG